MSGVAAVNARLKATAGVTALVGTRIFAGRLPHAPTLPAIRLAEVSQVHDHLMGADSGVIQERVQVDGFAAAYDVAKALAAAVKVALSRQRGTFGGVVVQDIALETEFDIYEETASTDDVRVYRVTQDYFLWWEG